MTLVDEINRGLVEGFIDLGLYDTELKIYSLEGLGVFEEEIKDILEDFGVPLQREVFRLLAVHGAIPQDMSNLTFNVLDQLLDQLFDDYGYKPMPPHILGRINDYMEELQTYMLGTIGEEVMRHMVTLDDVRSLPTEDAPQTQESFNVFNSLNIVLGTCSVDYEYTFIKFIRKDLSSSPFTQRRERSGAG